jgi:uncharacterized cupredoxin-like copper-binding protein
MAMKTKLLAVSVVLCGVVMAATPLFAHHGTSNYDRSKMVTVKGTVTKFEMVNPHVLIHFDVKNDKGVIEHWTAETQAPNMLTRAGWSKSILKPGDEITVTGNPTKDGSPEMRMEKLILSNGKELMQYPY